MMPANRQVIFDASPEVKFNKEVFLVYGKNITIKNGKKGVGEPLFYLLEMWALKGVGQFGILNSVGGTIMHHCAI